MNTQATSAKLIVFAIAFSLILGGWIFIGYKNHSYKKELSAIEKDARDRTNQNSYLISIKNALRDAKEDLAAIDSRFIAKDGIPDFINLLERTASDAGIKTDFGSITVDAKSLSIKMTGSGSWNRIVGFVSALDSLPYASKIEDVSIQRQFGAEPGTDVNWNFSLSLAEYLDTNALAK